MNSYPKTLCATCGKYFTSTSEFDAHRTGRYGHDRRCDELSTGWSSFAGLVTEYVNYEPIKQIVVLWSRTKSLEAGKRMAAAFKAKKPALMTL